jgi:hypothetical protein
MSKVQSGVWHSAIAAGNSSITALPSQSFMIKNVYVDGCSNDPCWVTLQTQQTVVGYFRGGNDDNNNLFMPQNKYGDENILSSLMRKKLFNGYPVASGETFTVTLSAGTGDIFIEYDIYQTNDIKDTDANGISAADILQVLYGTIGEAVAAAGYKKFDTSNMPAGFTDFPWSINFPSNYNGELVAMMSQSIDYNNYAGAANNYGTSQYTRLTLDQTVLFDQQEDGFPTIGDGAAAGSTNTVLNEGYNVMPWVCPNVTKDLYFFDPPVPLVPGNNLLIEGDVALSNAAATLEADSWNVGLVVALKKVK